MIHSISDKDINNTFSITSMGVPRGEKVVSRRETATTELQFKLSGDFPRIRESACLPVGSKLVKASGQASVHRVTVSP